MRKKRNIFLVTTLLIMVCLCISACTSSEDAQKDSVNSGQNIENDNNEADTDDTGKEAYEMPDKDYLEDDEVELDEESEEEYLEGVDEEVGIPEDDLTEEPEDELEW